MKKVLIADDEFLIRIGLKSIIPWEENGFTVVGEARNGREAVELFDQYDADILLTDIRMPIMGGLELIQTLKSRKTNLKCIILTHYDDFNYAKEAIKIGASEYILKSDLSPENLFPILKRLNVEIEKNDTPKLNSKEGILSDISSDIESVIKLVVEGNFKSKEDLNNKIKKISNVFNNCFINVANCELLFDEAEHNILKGNDEQFKKTIQNISKIVFNESGISYHCYIYKNKIFYLLNMKKSEEIECISDKLSNYLILLKKNIAQFLDIELIVGRSEISESLYNIQDLFNNSTIALEQCFFESSGVVVFNEPMKAKVGYAPAIDLELLKDYILLYDKERLKEYINLIFDELINIKQRDIVRDVFIDLLSHAKIIASELKIKGKPALNDNKFSYSNFERLNNFTSVRKYIGDIYNELIYQNQDNKSRKYSHIINKCIEYIKSHYYENITLLDVAEHVQISKSYLSLLFKEETGINFSNYLTNYRIRKSKALLLESDLKIYEVAEKVGFDNPYYFSKVFKDTCGMTCKEFKKANIS